MICLGKTVEQKCQILREYARDNGISKVFILSPRKFNFACDLAAEWIEYADIIEYRFFYRLLQEIDSRTLVVVNECLRTQNRHDLTYNCMRHFLNQAGHQVVFQWLPFIDDIEDFMILFDWDTRSQWRRERFDIDLMEHCKIDVSNRSIVFDASELVADAKTKTEYEKERSKLFGSLGMKDPHTIPRNLYLVGGKTKLSAISQDRKYLGRNDRFGLPGMVKYKEDSYPDNCVVFEVPHNFGDFADVCSLSGQQHFDILATDLKADRWYIERYRLWAQRISDGYASLSKWADCTRGRT